MKFLRDLMDWSTNGFEISLSGYCKQNTNSLSTGCCMMYGKLGNLPDFEEEKWTCGLNKAFGVLFFSYIFCLNSNNQLSFDFCPETIACFIPETDQAFFSDNDNIIKAVILILFY